MKRDHYLLILPALGTVLLDQVSKFVIVSTIHIYDSIPVIRGFFNLVHVRNRGMAFGLMNRPGSNLSYYFLVAATVGAIALLVFWFSRLKTEDRKIVPALSLVLGGAVGNLIDRLRLQEVIDFLDFFIGQYHWPAFNVADSAITIGTLWIAVDFLFRGSKNSRGVE